MDVLQIHSPTQHQLSTTINQPNIIRLHVNRKTLQAQHTPKMWIQQKYTKCSGLQQHILQRYQHKKLNSEHGTSQLQALLSLLHSTSPQQNLALITILWAQLLAGTRTPILGDVTNPLPHLYPMQWIPSI